ncbi:hypothetical protein AB0B28_10615 [Glycomyces sp. NPDC046736]|uniref:hypothetical protein n=1 Tax=Glycomyces sp. NPDC046736 TaxID=3155615 RepID=UPI0033FF7E52
MSRFACVGTVALALAACTDGGETASGESDELLRMLNESRRLEAEVVALEYRYIERCLEDRGHTVHQPRDLMTWEPAEITAIAPANPHARSLPEPDIAAEWGFGVWIYDEQADPDAWSEYEDATWPEASEDTWNEADDSEFMALSPEEQYSWYVDFLGRAQAMWLYGEHFGFEAPDENLPEDDDGEIVIDEDISEEPPPGGCTMEMIEELYGEPHLVSTEGGTADSVDGYVEWAYRPAVPLADVSPLYSVEAAIEQVQTVLTADFRGQIAAEEDRFLSCVADRGYGAWDFEESGGLNVHGYWGLIYDGADYTDGDGGPFPDPPSDLPFDFESLRGLEIAMAVDFAECADDSGLREAAETSWTDVNRDYYESAETAMFAWQEEMRGVIEHGQDLLDA